MYRFIRADTSLDVPCPQASPMDEMPSGLPWVGGASWKNFLDRPVALCLEDSPERPAGLADFFRTIDFRVVSAELRRVLEAVGADIEFGPATVVYRGEESARPFFVAIPLTRLAAQDRAQSDVRLSPNGTVSARNESFLTRAACAATRGWRSAPFSSWRSARRRRRRSSAPASWGSGSSRRHPSGSDDWLVSRDRARAARTPST